MTAVHTSKKAKFSYAERVVGALSQIQREQKKRSIHLATLRAKVRKNAQSRNDTLGPQWTNWMSKAVHKLEQQGVLEVPEPGHVALTVDAKRTITTARPQTGTQEDHIVKTVAQTSISCGLKRRRRSSVWTAPPNLRDEQALDSASMVTSRRTPTYKRARRQSDAPSKWTKAELFERYKSLEKAYATDVDNRDELYSLKEEYESVCRQLEEFRAHQDVTLDGDAQCRTPTRHTAEDSDFDSPLTETPTSSPLRPSLANIVPRRRSMLDVIRTGSGSLIDRYSKQSTSAPSTPGIDGPVEDDNIFDDNGPDMSTPHRSGALHGLATPTATPPIRRLALPLPADTRPHAYVSSFGNDVEARQAEIRELRSAHGQLVVEKNELQRLLSSRDADIRNLQARLGEQTNFTSTVANPVQPTETNQDENQSQASGLDGFAQDFRTKVSPLRSPVMEEEGSEDHTADLDRITGLLKARLEKLSGEKDMLAEELRRAVASEKSLQSVVQDTSVKFSELEHQYQDLQARHTRVQQLVDVTTLELTQHKEQLLVAQNEISDERNRMESCSTDFEAKLSDMQVSMDTLLAELEVANDAIPERETTISRLSRELGELEHRECTLKIEHTALNATIATLETRLADKNVVIEGMRGDAHSNAERLHSLEAAIASKDTAITKLHGIQGADQEQLSLLTSRLQDVNQKCVRLDLTLAGVQRCLDQKTSDVSDLQSRLATKEQTCEALQADLASATSDCDALRSELSSKLDNISSLQAGLASAQAVQRDSSIRLDQLQREKVAREEQLLAKLTEAQDSLSCSEEEISTLRATLQAAQSMRTDLETALAKREDEAVTAQAALHDEGKRVQILQAQLDEALAKAEEAEREADALCEAKLEDERSISALKETFEHLRKLQLESLTQAECEVASSTPSPLPKRRQSAMIFQA